MRGKKWLTLATTRFCNVTGMKTFHRMHLRLEVCLEEMAGKGGMITEIASTGLGFVKSSSLRIYGIFCRASNELSRLTTGYDTNSNVLLSNCHLLRFSILFTKFH